MVILDLRCIYRTPSSSATWIRCQNRVSYQQPTAVCFIDFSAAFDSIHRESLWRIMAPDGVPAKIIAMIKAYYRSTTARVLVHNNLSQPLGIRSGVRQGCILSRILFNYAIDWILERALHEGDGVEFASGHRLTDLDYADNIALLVSSFGDLQSMVSRVNEVAKSVGLSINAGKTKVYSSCIPDQEKAPLGIDGCQLEEVDSFKYFGARPLSNGQSKDDIVSRIDAAHWVFSSLRKCLWIRRDLSIATKIRVYRAFVRSVLLYGCECWAVRLENERKLELAIQEVKPSRQLWSVVKQKVSTTSEEEEEAETEEATTEGTTSEEEEEAETGGGRRKIWVMKEMLSWHLFAVGDTGSGTESTTLVGGETEGTTSEEEEEAETEEATTEGTTSEEEEEGETEEATTEGTTSEEEEEEAETEEATTEGTTSEEEEEEEAETEEATTEGTTSEEEEEAETEEATTEVGHTGSETESTTLVGGETEGTTSEEEEEAETEEATTEVGHTGSETESTTLVGGETEGTTSEEEEEEEEAETEEATTEDLGHEGDAFFCIFLQLAIQEVKPSPQLWSVVKQKFAGSNVKKENVSGALSWTLRVVDPAVITGKHATCCARYEASCFRLESVLEATLHRKSQT
ncbi:hypothetical protein SprV_0401436300 [Sparganum proliferum]